MLRTVVGSFSPHAGISGWRLEGIICVSLIRSQPIGSFRQIEDDPELCEEVQTNNHWYSKVSVLHDMGFNIPLSALPGKPETFLAEVWMSCSIHHDKSLLVIRRLCSLFVCGCTTVTSADGLLDVLLSGPFFHTLSVFA